MSDAPISRYSEQYLNLTPEQLASNVAQIERRVEAFRLRIDLAHILPFVVGPDVLDFPIGTGRFYPRLIDKYNIWGYDIAPAYIERARRLNPTIQDHFELARFEDIPTGRPFNTIVSLRVMNNVADFPAACRNVAAVLRPGGRWIFNYPADGRHFSKMPEILDAAGFCLVSQRRYDGYAAIGKMRRLEKALFDRFLILIEKGWIPFPLYRVFDWIYGRHGTCLWICERPA